MSTSKKSFIPSILLVKLFTGCNSRFYSVNRFGNFTNIYRDSHNKFKLIWRLNKGSRLWVLKWSFNLKSTFSNEISHSCMQDFKDSRVLSNAVSDWDPCPRKLQVPGQEFDKGPKQVLWIFPTYFNARVVNKEILWIEAGLPNKIFTPPKLLVVQHKPIFFIYICPALVIN